MAVISKGLSAKGVVEVEDEDEELLEPPIAPWLMGIIRGIKLAAEDEEEELEDEPELTGSFKGTKANDSPPLPPGPFIITGIAWRLCTAVAEDEDENGELTVTAGRPAALELEEEELELAAAAPSLEPIIGIIGMRKVRPPIMPGKRPNENCEALNGI